MPSDNTVRLGPRYGLRLATWAVYVVVWTASLLTPQPAAAAQSVLGPSLAFIAAKTLHVAAYAVLAALSGWLRAPVRLRWVLLAFLLAHALGTEFLQRFVRSRSPSWRDVGLDVLGIVVGTALTWRWWRAPDPGSRLTGSA